jgi:hypothetical protein
MADKKHYVLVHAEARRRAMAAVAEAPQGFGVTIAAPTRNLEQNAKLWATLGELADQVEWHGQKLTAAEWKDCLTAALKKQKVIPGIDGGFVVLGSSTSRMSKAEMSELLEFAIAFGAQHGVEFAEVA